LRGSHLAKDRRLLRQIPETEPRAQVHRQLCDVAITKTHNSCIGTFEANDHVKRGRLAGAIGPE
jgi:hypothetical protein